MPAVQAGIGITPTSVTFEKVLRDGYAETTFIVTTSIDNDIPIYVRKYGDIQNWLHFPTMDSAGVVGYVRLDKPLIVSVVAMPPGDVGIGDYTGHIIIESGALGSVGETIGSSIVVSLLSWTNVEITGEEIRSCQAGGIRIPETETNRPLEVSLVVKNSGNVRLYPEVEIDIWDQFEHELLLSETLTSEMVLPTTKGEQRFYLDHGLQPGQYWALVTVPECGMSELLTFDILPPGGVVDRGTLNSILSTVWALVGEIVPVTAVFTNTGERSVTAQFKGSALLNGKVVKLLESEEALVEPGESVELLMYFTPEEPGIYELVGRVHYNGKLTYEKGTLLNVNLIVRKAQLSIVMVSLYLIIVLAIAILVAVIKREKKKRRRRY